MDQVAAISEVESLRAEVESFRSETGKLRDALAYQISRNFEFRVALGDFRRRASIWSRRGIAPNSYPTMWAWFQGQLWVSPGGVFYYRREAISYACQITAMTWKELRASGHYVQKVHVAPI